MRFSYIFVTLLILGLACKKQANNPANVCGVKDPINNLLWLKIKVDELKSQQPSPGEVMAIRLEGQDFLNVRLMIQSCYPCGLYTCSGKPLSYEQDSLVIKKIMNNLNDLKVIATF